MGDGASATLSANGVWRPDSPTDDSIRITSQGALTIGGDAVLSANAYTGGDKTFAGRIALNSAENIVLAGEIKVDGNNGAINIETPRNVDISADALIHANAHSNAGIAGSIHLRADTVKVNGGLAAGTANGGIIHFTGKTFQVSSSGIVRTNTSGDTPGSIRLGSEANQDLSVSLNGRVYGQLTLNGDKSVSLEFGALTQSVEIKQVRANGNVNILASNADFESTITVLPGSNDKSIEAGGNVTLRSSDVLIAVSNASGGSTQKISAENVTVVQSTLAGTIKLGTSIEAKQTISLLAVGGIRQPGRNGVLMAKNVVLASTNENIASSNSPVIVTAPDELSPVNLSLSVPKGNVYAQSLGDVVITKAESSKTVSVSTQSYKNGGGGSIEVKANMVGERIFLETGARTNGNISILANLVASDSAVIEAGGSGDILGAPLITLSSPTLTLRTLTGNIHSTNSLTNLPSPGLPGAEAFSAILPFSLQTDTQNLTAVSGLALSGPPSPGEPTPVPSGGIVLINNRSNQSLLINNSTGGVRFVVESQGSIRTKSISAQFVGLSANLDLTVLSGASLLTNGGSIELRALRTFSTQPLSVVSSTEGNVDIFGGTSVRIGNSIISASTASTDARIGNVNVLARQEGTELIPAQDIPGLRVNGTVLWDRQFKVNTGSAGENIANGFGRVVTFNSNAKNAIFLTGGAAISAQGATGEESTGMRPICYTAPIPDDGTKKALSKDAMYWTDAMEGISLSAGGLQVCKGNVLLIARNDLTLKTGNLYVAVSQGACVHIKVDGDDVVIRNLFDRHKNSVCVTDRKISWTVSAGEQTIQGKIQSIVPHRLGKRLGPNILVEEFSIPGLLDREKVIKDVYFCNRQFRNNLLKSTASLFVITARRGPYNNNP